MQSLHLHRTSLFPALMLDVIHEVISSRQKFADMYATGLMEHQCTSTDSDRTRQHFIFVLREVKHILELLDTKLEASAENAKVPLPAPPKKMKQSTKKSVAEKSTRNMFAELNLEEPTATESDSVSPSRSVHRNPPIFSQVNFQAPEGGRKTRVGLVVPSSRPQRCS